MLDAPEADNLTCSIKEGVLTITGKGTYVTKDHQNDFTKVVIGKEVVLGDAAFKDCSKLEEVKFDETPLAKLPDHAFQNCASLKEITITATSIGNNVFEGCTSLTTVTYAGEATLTFSASILTGLDTVTTFIINNEKATITLDTDTIKLLKKLETLSINVKTLTITDGAFKDSTLTTLELIGGTAAVKTSALAGASK